jgi:aminoglycoside 2''-phosphotransferase
MVEKEKYLQKIRIAFPGLSFSRSKLLTHGWDDTVLILDNKIVFAFPKAAQESRSKFQKELLLLPKLQRRISLLIPTFSHIPKDHSFVGYRYISGVPLTRSDFARLSSPRQKIIARQIGQFLSELHGYPIRHPERLGIPAAWSLEDAETWCLDKLTTINKKLPLAKQKILEVLLSQKKSSHPFKPVLIHGDFTSDHILFDQKINRLSGIIDFGDAQIGDPANDIAKLWEYGESFVDSVLKKYRFSDSHIKMRSKQWYVCHCVGLLYFGITMNRKDYWATGYRIFQTKLET